MGCSDRDFAPTSITIGRGNLFPPTIEKLLLDFAENTCSVEWIKSGVEEFSNEIGGFVVSTVVRHHPHILQTMAST